MGVGHASGTGPYLALKALRMVLLFKVISSRLESGKVCETLSHVLL